LPFNNHRCSIWLSDIHEISAYESRSQNEVQAFC
jgi:hypothetical protein